MVRPVTRNRGGTAIQVGANGLEAPTPQAAPILSIDEFRSVIFIIRCARAIAFLQRFVPAKYLPPHEDRVPPSLLKRLIHELKKLIPKWKWISSGVTSSFVCQLGFALFSADHGQPGMSCLELWRSKLHGIASQVLDDAFGSLPYA